jgi:hypothetical protein
VIRAIFTDLLDRHKSNSLQIVQLTSGLLPLALIAPLLLRALIPDSTTETSWPQAAVHRHANLFLVTHTRLMNFS